MESLLRHSPGSATCQPCDLRPVSKCSGPQFPHPQVGMMAPGPPQALVGLLQSPGAQAMGNREPDAPCGRGRRGCRQVFGSSLRSPGSFPSGGCRRPPSTRSSTSPGLHSAPAGIRSITPFLAMTEARPGARGCGAAGPRLGSSVDSSDGEHAGGRGWERVCSQVRLELPTAHTEVAHRWVLVLSPASAGAMVQDGVQDGARSPGISLQDPRTRRSGWPVLRLPGQRRLH